MISVETQVKRVEGERKLPKVELYHDYGKPQHIRGLGISSVQEERVIAVKDATYPTEKRKPEQIKGFFPQLHKLRLSLR